MCVLFLYKTPLKRKKRRVLTFNIVYDKINAFKHPKQLQVARFQSKIGGKRVPILLK